MVIKKGDKGQSMKSIRGLVILGMVVSAGNVNAEIMVDLTPYIGAEYSQIWMKGRGNWSDVFPRRGFSGGGVYVGSKFHRNFGVELGYDISTRKKRDWELFPGIPFFNGVTTEKINARTTVRRHGGHIDLIGFLHITECLEFIGSAGVGWVKPKVFISTVLSSNGLASSSLVAKGLTNISSRGRGVFRLGFGLSYMVTEVAGVRTKFSWENTKTLRINGNQTFYNLAFDVSGFKSSTAVSLGGFLRF